MGISTVGASWLTTEDLSAPVPAVLLGDQDPISRHVLGAVLARTSQLRVLGSVDSQRPLREWPLLTRADVVVLGVGAHEDPGRLIRELSALRIKVLLVGVGWSRAGLESALLAGAAGCLVKDIDVGGLAGAIQAVAAGHIVLAPDLLWLYRSRDAQGPGAATEEPAGAARRAVERMLRTLTARERQVLALLASGMSTAEAAASLKVSPTTVKSHVSHLLTKLGARNRLEAVLLVQGALRPAHQHVRAG